MLNKPNIILKVTDYSIKTDDHFFFDNNIWMYIFCPIANVQKAKQKVYSKFFEYVISRKNHIYVNTLVLSEFSNRYLKLDYNLCNDSANPKIFNSYKRDYVGSDQFKATVSEVKASLNGILKVCQRCSDEFNHINVNSVFNLFEKIGFNDSYYIHLSELKDWIIVSDDSDITNANTPQIGLKILTYK